MKKLAVKVRAILQCVHVQNKKPYSTPKDFTIEAWTLIDMFEGQEYVKKGNDWSWYILSSYSDPDVFSHPTLRFGIFGFEGKLLGLQFSLKPDVQLTFRRELLRAYMPIPLNTWVHVAVVRKGQKLIFYLNGNAVQDYELTKEGSDYVIESGPQSLIAEIPPSVPGVLPPNRYCFVSEPRIWARALDPDELLLHCQQARCNKCEVQFGNLLAKWTFTAGSENARDESQYGNDGSVMSSAEVVEKDDSQSSAPASSCGAVSPLLQLDPNGKPTLLNYSLAESVSYRGRNIVELNLPGEYFLTVSDTDAVPPAGGKAVRKVGCTFRASDNYSPRDVVVAGREGFIVIGNDLHAVSRPGYYECTTAVKPDDFAGHVQVPGELTREKRTGGKWERDITPTVSAFTFMRPADTIAAGPGNGHRDLVKPDGVPNNKQNRPDRAAYAAKLDIKKKTGYFDPEVFPLMAGSTDNVSVQGIKEALAGVNSGDLADALALNKSEFLVYRSSTGSYQYRFVPKRVQPPRPRLLLIEQYRLSSFLGKYGAGRTIKTLSLLPGENTTLYVKSYKGTEESQQRSSSIVDSTTHETERDFERETLMESSSQDAVSSSFEYHADVEAKANATWGWGEAALTISGGVSGTSDSARELFAKNVSNSVQHNADRASSFREVTIQTSDERRTETWDEQGVERQLRNINVSRTLNFAFRQLNQEYFSVLHLIDIRVAFFNGYRESRTEYPLHELPRLLQTFMEKHREPVEQSIWEHVLNIKPLHGTASADFVKTEGADAEKQEKGYLIVNTKCTSTWCDPTGTEITVPGVIVGVNNHIMRTDAVVVDSFLGLGNALDEYSRKLQSEATRRETLTNERLAIENKIVEEGLAAFQSDQTNRSAILQGLLSALKPPVKNPGPGGDQRAS